MWAALAAAAIPAITSMVGQMTAGGKQGAAEAQSMENLLFQKAQAQRQYELATAGREDVRGNKTMYVPGKGWIQIASPETASQVSMSDDLSRKELVRQMTSGEIGRNRDARVKVEESAAAEPLLRDFADGNGKPDREVVRGRRAVSNVTSATENADRLNNAASGAALRQGSSTVPLGANLSTLNRNATAGIRSGLARADEEGDEMFQAMTKAYTGNKLDPYNMLATRAGGGTPFKPESLSGDVAGGLNQAATVGGVRGVGGSGEVGKAYGDYAAMIGNRPTQNWDMFANGIAGLLKNQLNKSGSEGAAQYNPNVDYDQSGSAW